MKLAYRIACFCLLLLGLQIPSVAGEASPTLDKIAARGSIHLGFRESAIPFSYLQPGQAEPVGYLWGLCQRVVQGVEARVGKSLRVVPVASTENARIMLLKTGVIDLDCGASVNSVAREKQVGFSLNVYFSELRALVRAGTGVEQFGQLAGKRIVVLAGGIVERQLKQAALAGNMTFQLFLAATADEAGAMLAKGEVDAFVGEDVVLAALAARQGNGWQLLPGYLVAEPFAIMMPKDDPVFKQLVDAVLVALMQSGEFQAIYEKWFVSPIAPSGLPLGLPLSDLLKASIAAPNDKPVN